MKIINILLKNRLHIIFLKTKQLSSKLFNYLLIYFSLSCQKYKKLFDLFYFWINVWIEYWIIKYTLSIEVLLCCDITIWQNIEI